MYLRACAVLFVLVAVISAPTGVLADFQQGIPVYSTQPDGSKLELRAWGDEYFQTTATIDGYTVTRDPADGWICYAKLSADGSQLLSTGARVGSVDPGALGLAPGPKISDAAIAAIVKTARDRQQADLAERLDAVGLVPAAPSLGNVKGITILIDFDDEVGTILPAEVDDYCNLVGYTGYANNGSVRDYFHDVSDGLLTYTNDVTATYYRADSLKSWYEDTSVQFAQRAQILVLEALNDLEANGFDFSQYDGNGDGWIDAINILYAGFRGSTWAAGLWPHSGGLYFVADGVSVLRYQMTDLRDQLRLSTFCHENGHMICWFPDLYDYDHDSFGIGRFGLMCNSGSATNPVEPCGPLKRYADWVTDQTLVFDQTGLTVSAGINDVYLYPQPGSSTEYYVIENRQQTGRDAAMPGSGLAVWHVDETGDNDNQQMTPESHYEVTLVQADGLWQLENKINMGDSTDLWQAPTLNHCTPFTMPATTWWDGSLSGLALLNISASGSVMTFDFVDASGWTADCNGNGIDDALDISSGTSTDLDANGVPDECTTPIGDIQFYNASTGLPESPHENEEVTVAGVVYALKGTLTQGGFYLQDETGGINYYAPYAEGIALGDTIRVTALVFHYDGELYLHDSRPTPEFVIVGNGPEPESLEFTVEDLVDTYDNVGWFAKAQGTVSDLGAAGFTLNDNGFQVAVHIAELTGINLTNFQNGSPVTVQGACVIRNGDIQLWPRYQADLVGGHDPTTLYVAVTGSDDTGDGSEGNPYATIQHAIDLAVNGDEIWVLPGTYTGDGNRDIDFLGKAITVKSRDEDPTTCIIDCQGSEADPHRGFIFQNREGSDSALKGFTVTNGYDPDFGGGGIRLFERAPVDVYDMPGPAPTLGKLTVEGNHGSGLVIDVENYGGIPIPPIIGCSFSNNQGDGFRVEQSHNYLALNFLECEFLANSGIGFANFAFVGYQTNFSQCTISNNGSTGLRCATDNMQLVAAGCTIDGNQGAGVELTGTEYQRLDFRDSVISNNLGSGVTNQNWYSFSLKNCEISGNGDRGLALRMGSWDYCWIDSCRIVDNGAAGIEFLNEDFAKSGLGARAYEDDIAITNSEVAHNNGPGITGFELLRDGPTRIAQSLVFDNRGHGIDLEIIPGYEADPTMLRLEEVTVAGNDSLGVAAAADSLVLTNVIVANNGGASLAGLAGDYLELACNDFFANAGGDWSGALAPYLGVDGNISADPRFCNLAGGELTLRSDSPCLPWNHPDRAGCGQIGALGLGCFIPEPVVADVTDVGEDQGREVLLEWVRSDHDDPVSATPILEYEVFRRNDAVAASDKKAGDHKAPSEIWDSVLTIPAEGLAQYAVAVPTLEDSTITHGLHLSVFYIRAGTEEPAVFFDSAPDSGYSVDNLAPQSPESFHVAYSPQNDLTWGLEVDPDFSSFKIYAGDQDDFTVDPANPLHTTAEHQWLDVSGSYNRYYKIAAVDLSGNESEAVAPATVSAIQETAPTQFALLQNHPNPFNPMTTIRYEVPQASAVSIRIFDVSGRLVRRLLEGDTRPAGRHEATWRGQDDQGKQVAAGVYFYQIEAGAFTATKRMTLLK